MKKFSKIFLFFLSLFFLLFSLHNLYKIYNEYHTGEEIYEKIEKEVITIKKTEEKKTEKKKEEEITIDIDFEKLKKKNKDCVGWIYIPGTNINYPIVQSTDNDYCLNHTFDGVKNISGSIFISEMNDCFNDKNTIIYGHNMQNGTMFTNIKKYKNKSFMNSHKYIYISTEENGMEKYRVFSAYITEDCSEAYTIEFGDEFLSEISKMMNKSLVKVKGVGITEDNKIITLSTCTSRTKTERFVVHAVKIR